jgi:hypothetical protein
MQPRLHAQIPPGLPASLQSLTAPCYLHRVHQGLWVAMLGLTLALVVAGLAYGAWQWLPHRLGAAELAFGLLLLLFLGLLLRPSMWRAPITMAADRQGIYFVGSNESLLVPWRETGPFSIERVRVSEGVSESVIVTISTQSDYWQAARRSRFMKHMLGAEQPPGFLRVPLGTQGIDPALTRASLEALRSLSGYRDEHPDYSPGPKRRAWELVAGGVFFLGVALLFAAIMLKSALSQQQGLDAWLAIPLLMAAFAIGVIRYGWRPRH